MDKTCELGIKYLEIFPGQRFGGYQSVEYECNWEDSVPDYPGMNRPFSPYLR